MTYTADQLVSYRGDCYKIARQEPDGRWLIYPRRRGWGKHIATVAEAELSPWVQPVKDRSKAMTCQICGRLIMAARGLIAHHGYQRPQGWHEQTASCLGARFKPFEHDCSRLRWYIDSVLHPHAGRLTERIAELRSDAPAIPVPGPEATMRDRDGRAVYHAGGRMTHRPPIGPEHPEYWTYRTRAIGAASSELDAINHEIQHQGQRLRAWKAP